MKQTGFNSPSPVLLSSSCVVKANATGVPDYTQLSYPFRKALWINEIRFDLYCNAADFTTTVQEGVPQLGSIVYAQMQLGRHYINRDYVPIWLLGTAMTAYEEGIVDTTLATPFAYSHYRWRLPSPLYVQAGETLRTTLSRATPGLASLPMGTTQDITAQISYAGSVVPPSDPLPKQIVVPYVAPFVTPWGVTYDQSNENDLFNPFNKPLLIQRMTGRVLVSADDGLGKTLLQQAERFTPSTANNCMEVQVFDSWGGKLVPTLTGPSDVWDASRSAWTYDTVMPPKGMYEVRVWNIPTVTKQQLHVAMIGSREEAL